MKLSRLRWPWKKPQAEEEATEGFIELSTTEALYNRAAMNRETLRLYQRMIAAPREALHK